MNHAPWNAPFVTKRWESLSFIVEATRYRMLSFQMPDSGTQLARKESKARTPIPFPPHDTPVKTISRFSLERTTKDCDLMAARAPESCVTHRETGNAIPHFLQTNKNISDHCVGREPHKHNVDLSVTKSQITQNLTEIAADLRALVPFDFVHPN